jgi:hypothetical protein
MTEQTLSRRNFRILVIDDQVDIHDDYQRSVGPRSAKHAALRAAAADLFGEETAPESEIGAR